MTQIHEAIDEGNFEKFTTLVQNNWILIMWGIDYLVVTKGPDFTIDFIRQVGFANGCILAVLFAKGSKETIDKVLKETNPSQGDLVDTTEYSELMHSPQKFIGLLNVIAKPKDQELAVRNGIITLFIRRDTGHVKPLLAALENEGSLGGRLKDVAIQEAFKRGAEGHREFWVKYYYDYSIITPEVYAEALSFSGRVSVQAPIFKRLLAAASLEDLQAVKGRDDYEHLSSNLRAAIEQALPKAKSRVTRINYLGPKALAAKKIVCEIATVLMPDVIADIIASYVTDRACIWRRIKAVNQAINGIIGASCTTMIIGDIIGGYVGDDFENQEDVPSILF